MNSREKGKRGERQWRDELREAGFAARRGQQFSGSPESPDVICEDLWWMHFEVKCVERLNIEDAMDQARTDCGGSMPVVAHKRKHRRWLVTIEAKDFFKLVREAMPHGPSDQQRTPINREQVDTGEHRPEVCATDTTPPGWRRIEGDQLPADDIVNDVTLRIPHVARSNQNKNNNQERTKTYD